MTLELQAMGRAARDQPSRCGEHSITPTTHALLPLQCVCFLHRQVTAKGMLFALSELSSRFPPTLERVLRPLLSWEQ